MEKQQEKYQNVQRNLKPLSKMAGMYGYAEKIRKSLSAEGVSTSLFVVYRAVEGSSKSIHAPQIRKLFLEMVEASKNAVTQVEELAERMLQEN